MTIETIQLDWRGMRCPEPILKTARKVRKLRDGQDHRIQIYADDDAFPMDIQSWCTSSGVKLMAIEERDGYYEAILQLEGEPGAARQTATTSATIQPAASPAPTAATAPREHLDCIGMACPEPILKLARAYRKLPEGTQLEITASDDSFPIDLQSWLKGSGATLITLDDGTSPFKAVIEKPGATPQPAVTPPVAATIQPTPQPIAAPRPAATAPQIVAAPSSSNLALQLDGISWEDGVARLESMTGPHWKGETIDVSTSDAARLQKLVGWVGQHGHELVRFEPSHGLLTLRVGEGADAAAASTALVPATKAGTAGKRATFLVIHNDFESLMAALMIANTSAAQNIDTSIFFSFWGVNLLRGNVPRSNEQKKPLTFIHRMFRMMMPSGPSKQPLSKMHFGGMGKQMMLASMRQQNVMDLETLMEAAIENGVKFTVCTMSMSIMGIQKRDIMDRPNIEFAGVASFVADSAGSDISMVF